MSSPVAVVIPIYKEQIDDNEKKSLQQCLSVLGTYPIIFACPDNLSTTYYSKTCSDSGVKNFKFITFNNNYFESVSGYNKLLLSPAFYAKFEEYNYVLLYQLDAYVFKDELMQWCDKGFSYIGAPWFKGQDKSTSESGFMEMAGNGGFSLRNIPDFLKVLRTYKIMESPAKVFEEYQKLNAASFFIRIPVMLLKMMGFRNNSNFERSKFQLNEDHYWAFHAVEIVPSFKVARAEEAIAFAFECQPKRMLALNKNQLPFGVHAWLKYDFDFWKPYIA